MEDRWVPTENSETPLWGLHESLYAIMGPELSQLFVEAVETSGQSGIHEIRQVADGLKEVIGSPPSMLFLMGVAIAGLETGLQNRHQEDEKPEARDLMMDRLGWESYKHFGSAYVHMFERFGFAPDTLRHYMQNCGGFAVGYKWPPPGVAYRPMQSEAREG